MNLPDHDPDRASSRLSPQSVEGRFAVVLNCIDGRAQQPLLEWVRARYGVDYVDVVTEPGVDAVLALGDAVTLEVLLDRVRVSQRAHLARNLVVAGHHDCAANAVPRPVHEAQIRTAVHRVRAALPEFEVAGVYLDQSWTPSFVVDHDA